MSSRRGVISHPHRDLEWPVEVPYASLAAALGMAVIALAQRDALAPPTIEVAYAVVAVSPWLVEHLTRWMPPRPLMVAVTIAGLVPLLLDPAEIDFAPFILVVLCAEVGATGTRNEGLFALVASVGTMVGLNLADQFDGAGVWVAGIVAGWGFGYVMQLQLCLVAETRAHQAEMADKAATDERQRIAREVHDVIAHSLSVTLLHLTGARHALESGEDPAEVVDALRDAERLGRHAMVDIRRTVGLLQPGAESHAAPLPGIPDIEQLAHDFAAAGLDVSCRISGDPASVSAATGLGLYRIAQESLANVAKHAPESTASVTVDLDGDEARLVVRNGPINGRERPRPVGADGHGLNGMSQRAQLLGGALVAGPEGDQWLVDVALPVGPLEGTSA